MYHVFMYHVLVCPYPPVDGTVAFSTFVATCKHRVCCTLSHVLGPQHTAAIIFWCRRVGRYSVTTCVQFNLLWKRVLFACFVRVTAVHVCFPTLLCVPMFRIVFRACLCTFSGRIFDVSLLKILVSDQCGPVTTPGTR